MKVDSSTAAVSADEGTVYSFKDYLRLFLELKLKLPAEAVDKNAWLDVVAELCRLSRDLIFASLRERLRDPEEIGQATEAMCEVVHILDPVCAKFDDLLLTDFRDHIRKRAEMLSKRAAPEGILASQV